MTKFLHLVYLPDRKRIHVHVHELNFTANGFFLKIFYLEIRDLRLPRKNTEISMLWRSFSHPVLWWQLVSFCHICSWICSSCLGAQQYDPEVVCTLLLQQQNLAPHHNQNWSDSLSFYRQLSANRANMHPKSCMDNLSSTEIDTFYSFS